MDRILHVIVIVFFEIRLGLLKFETPLVAEKNEGLGGGVDVVIMFGVGELLTLEYELLCPADELAGILLGFWYPHDIKFKYGSANVCAADFVSASGIVRYGRYLRLAKVL